MNRLTKLQIKKANKLLKILCSEGRIDTTELYSMFDSKDETESVCSFLKSQDALSMGKAGDSIHWMNKNENTCLFLKNKILQKEHGSNNRTIFSGKLNIIFLIVSIVAIALNIVLILSNKNLTTNQLESSELIDSLKSENMSLIEKNELQAKKIKKLTELFETLKVE